MLISLLLGLAGVLGVVGVIKERTLTAIGFTVVCIVLLAEHLAR